MMIYRFCFDSEQQAKALIDSLPDEPQNVQVHDRGTLYDSVDTGNLNDDGLPVFKSIPLPGYHIDVCSRHALELDQTYLIKPKSPMFEF